MPDPAAKPPILDDTPRRSARAAIVCVLVCAAVLLLAKGPSIRESADRMDPGIIRTVVSAVGAPAGWVGDRLPFADATDRLTSWLSPDDDLGSAGGGFEAAAADGGGPAPVTPDAFAPADLGERAPARRALRKVLVTGDSMAMPLDAVLARRFADGSAVQVTRDPHVGTGISKSGLVDWGKLSARQAETDGPDATVVFLGANEGFPMAVAGGEQAECCGADWAAAYATRARRMMATYAREGAGRVYWLTLPLPRDPRRQAIARSVNAAVRAAAAPYRAQVRVLDAAALLTPGGRYSDELEIDGRAQLVRDPDGIHLNERGSELAADEVQRAMRADFEDVP